MKRLILVLTVLVTALVAPLQAQGQPDASTNDVLRVRLELPVTFTDPTSACPAGVVHYGISADGDTGTGRNCLLGFIEGPCSIGAALFCQEVVIRITLRLPGGTIKGKGSIFEVWTCGDPACDTLAVDQLWSGEVTRATGEFAALKGAPISGGGTLVFDAATFEILSLDEVLVIGEDG